MGQLPPFLPHLPLIILESSSTEDKETLLRPEYFTEPHNLIFSITNLLPRLGSWSIDYVTAPWNTLASSVVESKKIKLGTSILVLGLVGEMFCHLMWHRVS
ncbi:hypothetical protein YC2023_053955 [Brassica napus]